MPGLSFLSVYKSSIIETEPHMDLKQIRKQIFNITDFSPELQAYGNQIDELINEAYLKLWTSKRWNFAQKLSWLEAYPDITKEREKPGALVPITAAYNDGQRLITFSSDVYTLFNKKDIYEGNLIQLGSSTGAREYTILQVLSTTQITTSEPIRLLDGVASVAADGDWRVKARFYTLPEDCIEILNLQHRDVPIGSGGTGQILPPYGKTVALLPRMEETFGLREDYTQTYAECYVPVPPKVVPAAEKLGIAFAVQEDEDLGNIPENKYFEICWSFMSPEKQVGPLSQSVIVKSPDNPQGTSTYNMTVSFLTWDDKPMASKNTSYTSGPGTARPLESLRKVLWYNQNFNPATGERLGLPKWRQIVVGRLPTPSVDITSQDDPITALDTEASTIIKNITSFDPGTKQYREWEGQHLRIRPYPRIDAFDLEYDEISTAAGTPLRLRDFFRRLELRYYYKPNYLAAETDTPEIPYDMHQVIVYTVLEDVFNKSGNVQLANVYKNKGDMAIKGMERRYVDHTDINVIKGQFGTFRYGPVFDQNSLRNKSL